VVDLRGGFDPVLSAVDVVESCFIYKLFPEKPSGEDAKDVKVL
jgi:hypothetical protein